MFQGGLFVIWLMVVSLAVQDQVQYVFSISSQSDDLNQKLKIFDWQFYVRVYPALQKNYGVTSSARAIDHYVKFGFKENRWISPLETPSLAACIHVLDILTPSEFATYCNYSIFNSTNAVVKARLEDQFDWKFYLQFNPDLKNINDLYSEQQALKHYRRYGFYEQRWSNPNEQPSRMACNRAKHFNILNNYSETFRRDMCNQALKSTGLLYHDISEEAIELNMRQRTKSYELAFMNDERLLNITSMTSAMGSLRVNQPIGGR